MAGYLSEQGHSHPSSDLPECDKDRMTAVEYRSCKWSVVCEKMVMKLYFITLVCW